MYPDGELKRLARHKEILRERISLRREECAIAAAAAARPLAWLDRVVALWRQIRPLARVAAIPLGLLAKRLFFPRLRLFTSLFRWAPAIFGAVKLASAMRRP